RSSPINLTTSSASVESPQRSRCLSITQSWPVLVSHFFCSSPALSIGAGGSISSSGRATICRAASPANFSSIAATASLSMRTLASNASSRVWSAVASTYRIVSQQQLFGFFGGQISHEYADLALAHLLDPKMTVNDLQAAVLESARDNRSGEANLFQQIAECLNLSVGMSPPIGWMRYQIASRDLSVFFDSIEYLHFRYLCRVSSARAFPVPREP